MNAPLQHRLPRPAHHRLHSWLQDFAAWQIDQFSTQAQRHQH